MYTGIKRQLNKADTQKINGKIRMLTNEETEKNGIINKQIKFKTKEFKRDKTITWKDFEINNLIAAGIDPNSLSKTSLGVNIETLDKAAANAEETLNRYELIHQLEMEETNNETTTEQAQ